MNLSRIKGFVSYALGFVFYRSLLVLLKGKMAPCWYKKKKLYINLDKSTPYHVFNSTIKLGKMIESIGSAPTMVFDIGANCGFFSALLNDHYPSSRIYCFEPSSNLIPVIERNCGSNITILPVAISDSDKMMNLYINPDSQQTNSLFSQAVQPFLDGNEPVKEQVQCRSIDSLCKEYDINQIDILKVDVQGAEREVLKGAAEILPKVKILFLEATWLDIESVQDIFTVAREYGFKHLSVINAVYMGADLVLYRDKNDITPAYQQNSFCFEGL